MQGNNSGKVPVNAVSNSMIEFFERRENPPSFDLKVLNEKLEEVDPGGKAAMKSAIEMYNKGK